MDAYSEFHDFTDWNCEIVKIWSREILKSCNSETVKSWNQAFQYYVTVIAIQI